MAKLAIIARSRMLRSLANGLNAVVAAAAVSADIGMVEHGACPGNGSMAIVADITARDVAWVFAGRGHAVVAAEATSQNRGMIHA